MEFKHIEYFIDTCGYRSISQASEALFISQQALSKCIANMETELGCRLFDRTAKGIQLTTEGQLFYDRFLPVVQSYRSTLSETMAQLDHRPQTVSFACAPQIFRGLDANLLLSFQESHPDITLEKLEMSDKDVDRYVKQDVRHFGLLAIPENRHGKRFPFCSVHTQPLCLYVHKDNPISELSEVDFGRLRRENFLTLEKRSHYHSLIDEKAKEAGFTPKKIFSSGDIDQLCALVNSGKGIFIAADMPVVHGLYPNIRFIPFTDKTINYCVAFIFQDYEQLSKSARQFIEYIRENA